MSGDGVAIGQGQRPMFAEKTSNHRVIATQNANFGITYQTTIARHRFAHWAIQIGQKLIERQFAQVMQQAHNKSIITIAESRNSRHRACGASGAECMQPERPRAFDIVS